MPDYDDDKYVDLSPQLQENDEYVDLSPQLKASDEYVNLSPFKKEGGTRRPASDANQYENLSPLREDSEYQVLHVPKEDEPYQVLHVPREDEPYQVFDMKTNKMIELNKAQPDQMIELNKMREKYGVGEKAAQFAVNFQNSFFSALNKGQFFQYQNPESPEENEPVFVMNIPSPPPATVEEKYVFMQEAAELSLINVASFNNAARNINRINQTGSANTSAAFHVANKSGTQPNFELDPWKCCDENNLAHPPWYLGFWRDTYIDIAGEILDPFNNATLKITFGNLDNPKPVINFKHVSTGRVPSPAKPIPIDHRFDISDYSSNYPGYGFLPGSPNLMNAIGGSRIGNKINPPTGWLIVWNADIWKCQLARETINYHDYDFDGDYGWENHDYNYICPELFDHITLSIGRENKFELTSIKIVLNGIIILERSYSTGFPSPPRPVIGHYKPLVLDNRIKSYRHNSLTYRNSESPDNPLIGYSKNKILSNNILTLASKELGQSWSPRYAPEARWKKDLSGQNWVTGPDAWCADFTSWLYENVHNVQNPELIPFDLGDLMGYFRRKRLYVSASNCSYEDIGNRIQPGDFATVRQGQHGVIFLYWIDAGIFYPRDFRKAYRKKYWTLDAANIIYDNIIRWNKDLNPNSNPDPTPGPFLPDAPINWFVVINGNSGGGRVKKSVVPVVNLRKRDQKEMSIGALYKLFQPRSQGIHGVLWSEVGNWNVYPYIEEDAVITNYEDGFALTKNYR